MNKVTRRKIIIFFTLLCICAGCSVSDDKDTEGATDRKYIQEKTESDVDSEQIDPKDANLLCLMHADMEPLFGLSFGDRIDYTRFEVCGGWDDEPVFREIDSRQDYYVIFFFRGEGRCFSGFETGKLGFLGIEKEDGLERLTALYGEPDTFEKQRTKVKAQWNFEKALLVVTLENGVISYVRYNAVEGIADGEKIPYEQTDFARDCKGGYDYTETVYQWEPGKAESDLEDVSDSSKTDVRFHPYDEGYDADDTDEFVKEYLQKQGIEKAEPDGTLYNRDGELLVEYYIEESQNKYCFIVHMWGNYMTNFEEGIREYQDAVFCTTHVLEESDWAGTLLYNVDNESEIIRERLYDTEGMNKSDISYKSKANEPAASMTDYWYLENGYDARRDVLCRGQKFWFREAQIGADDTEEAGEPIDDAYFSAPCTFSYDEKGRIALIEEALIEGENEGWENSGQAEFRYDENGILKEADYERSSWTQGTTDSDGMIAYDEKGRMIYNDYYITHGRDVNIFLYKEDSDMPWACLNWCCFLPGFSKITIFERN